MDAPTLNSAHNEERDSTAGIEYVYPQRYITLW